MPHAMRKNNGGFTLVEIVVAAAIISFSLVSMVAIASNSIAYSRRALYTFTTPPDAWALATTPHTDGIFTRIVTFAAVSRSGGAIVTNGTGSVDSGTRLVTVTVSWQEGGVTVTKTVSAYISDIYT